VRILLVGAGGRLGRVLQGESGSQEIVALDHAQLDVTDEAAVREAVSAHTPDVVINTAAYNKVDEAETDRDAAFRLNADGPRYLAQAAAEHGIPMVHISTDYVFDGTKTSPYIEDDAPHPLSIYGRSKLDGEEAVRRASPRHLVVRTAWLFHDDGPSFPRRVLERAAAGPVRAADDQRGSPTYVPHLARALLALVQMGAHGTYHLAGRGEASWYDLAREVFRAAGLDARLERAPSDEFRRPAPRPAYSALATVREPRVLLPTWQDGVAEFLQRTREHR
jgi:dTDP-4-dehydrorhamnose reductase